MSDISIVSLLQLLLKVNGAHLLLVFVADVDVC
jgi:hypothetical protein